MMNLEMSPPPNHLRRLLFPAVLLFLILSSACQRSHTVNDHFLCIAGEPGQHSVIIQCRFADTSSLVGGDIPGLECVGAIQLSDRADFRGAQLSRPDTCEAENDFMTKAKFVALQPGTRYYYRGRAYLPGQRRPIYSRTGSFTTLPGHTSEDGISFAIATGFNYENFHGMDTTYLRKNNFNPKLMAADGEDSLLGFEAFETLRSLDVDFFIANGDVVYYDKPSNLPDTWARNLPEMRAKWHRFFSMPRNRAHLAETPYYFLKDDHDHRFNDCDTTNAQHSEPSHRLGIEVFREQVPVTDPRDRAAVTYRSHRAGKHLQLWFLEGRDYRSPNSSEDGPEKTIWGDRQEQWLRRTLLESDATYKIVISPTPMIGPDDAYKRDNHTNPGGFRHERDAFFSWLDSTGLKERNFYIICGDRHWQYHSIHPEGIEEFSCGAIIDQNSRPGRPPGDPASTDPEGLLDVPYLQDETNWGGGFLLVDLSAAGGIPTLDFRFYDKKGGLRYSVLRIPERERVK